MSVFTQIPPPSSLVVDPKTGQITGLWYNYLVNFSAAVTGFLLASNNLSDLTNTTTARTNLGALGVTGAVTITTLGTIATGTWNGTTIRTIYGGTGLTGYIQGDLIYCSATDTLSKLAKNTTATRYLSNTGTTNNPAWAQVDLSNGVTGSLPTSSLSGSISLTTQVSGRLPYANLTQATARSVLGVTGNSTADVASIQGTANQALVINSAGTALAFGAVNLASSAAVTGNLLAANLGNAVTSVNVQVFTSSGTYTPTSGMKYCIIECMGGGGGGGGAATANAGTQNGSGGGGGGGYSRKLSTAATIGASKTVTIGAGGTGATAGNNAGGNGGDTSVGVICVGKGGTGGGGAPAGNNGAGGAGGVSGTGDMSMPGEQGTAGTLSTTSAIFPPMGKGGNSCLGFGGVGIQLQNGFPGTGYGGGGGGGCDYNASGNRAGGTGASGLVIVTEFI